MILKIFSDYSHIGLDTVEVFNLTTITEMISAIDVYGTNGAMIEVIIISGGNECRTKPFQIFDDGIKYLSGEHSRINSEAILNECNRHVIENGVATVKIKNNSQKPVQIGSNEETY